MGKVGEEKEVFEFATLRAWSAVLPVYLEMERLLRDKNDCPEAHLIRVNLREAMEQLVIGYYKFYVTDKYPAYNAAREKLSVVHLYNYLCGFSGVIQKEKVLEMGAQIRDAIKRLNALIKNLENKIKRMDDARRLSERLG